MKELCMKWSLAGLFCLCVFAPAQAQRPGGGRPGGERQGPPGVAIFGQVLDNNEDPVPYASVALYRAKDSTMARGVATDEKGMFRLRARPGKYFLKISFLSLEEKVIPIFQVEKDDVNLKRITLLPGAVDLDEVTVEADKSQMELHLDKRVFNVGKDLRSSGSNASEILDNIPSVTVDIEGNVSLRGSENVRILVDGKPSGLTGISSADALRQLQGDLVERVEVITNPSARYDAEGEVGIINIVLKKEKRKGVNGTISARAGVPDNYGLSFNLNWRRKKFNLFTSYGGGYRETPGSGYSLNQFNIGDSSFAYSRNREHTRGGLSQNFRVGSDYFINDRNTLTGSFLYRTSDGDNVSEQTYRDLNNLEEVTQTVIRTETETEVQQDIELNLNYRKTFSRKGRELTANVRWNQNDDTETADLSEISDNPLTADIDQRSSNEEDQENWILQTDYVHPFGKEGTFETGLKSSLRTVINDYRVEQLNEAGEWQVLPAFDNLLEYQENIHAAYVMGGTKIDQFSFQLGLRAEYSDISTELVDTQEKNPREYLDLFPSVHLSYEIDKQQSFQLSYSRRISRPRFRHLLPFFSFSDNRSFFSGNPNVNPEYTNSYEVGYLHQWEKSSVFSSVYYRHRTGVIQRITVVDSIGFSRVFPINLATEDSYGLEFTFSREIAEWWNLNGSFNFFRAVTSGSYEGEDLFADTYTWNTRTTSKWKLGKLMDGQLSFNYRAPRETAQGRNKSVYNLDAGISREVLKGKGTLTASVRDLFNTRKRRSETFSEGFQAESEFQWRARQFMLNFSYRINQKKRRSRGRGGEGFDGDDMGF